MNVRAQERRGDMGSASVSHEEDSVAKCNRCENHIPSTGHQVCIACMHQMMTGADEARKAELQANIDEVLAWVDAKEATQTSVPVDMGARIRVIRGCLACDSYDDDYSDCLEDPGAPRRVDYATVAWKTPSWCPLPTVQDLVDDVERDRRAKALPLHKRAPSLAAMLSKLFEED